jgi:hypothetical protein
VECIILLGLDNRIDVRKFKHIEVGNYSNLELLHLWKLTHEINLFIHKTTFSMEEKQQIYLTIDEFCQFAEQLNTSI